MALFGSIHAQTLPAYLPTNGLVGWWPFNGNANDESGNGNHGTVNGATLTAGRNGNANSAYDFDGNEKTSLKLNCNYIFNSLNDAKESRIKQSNKLHELELENIERFFNQFNDK